MRIPNWATDKTRRGVTNRLLVASLILSVPAFFWTERHLQTVSPFRTVTLPFDIASVDLAPDKSAIVVSAQSGSSGVRERIAVYDFPSLRERWRTTISEAQNVRFSPDGTRVLMDNYAVAMEWDARNGFWVASRMSRLKDLVWSVETGTVERHYQVFEQGEGAKKKWFLQDTRGGEPVFLQNVGEPGWETAVLTPNNKHLIAVNTEIGSIRCWRTADGKPLPVPGAWRDLNPVALYPTPDKKLIALCRDNIVKEIDFSLDVNEMTAAARTLSAFPADRFHFGRPSDKGRFLHVTGSRIYLHGVRTDDTVRVERERMRFGAGAAIHDETVEQIIDRRTGTLRTFTDWGGETRFEMLGDSGWAYNYPGTVRPLGEGQLNRLLTWAAIMTRPYPRLHDLHTGEEWFVPDRFSIYTARSNARASADGSMMVTSHGARLEFWKLPRRRNQ